MKTFLQLPSVVVAQLGARDHYAYARAFNRAGVCDALVTDFWWSSQMNLPGNTGRRVRSRFHKDLSGVKVLSSNWSGASFELRTRLEGGSHWETILTRNEFFQRQAKPSLEALEETSEPRCLFAYSYAARDLFRWAKDRGWKTILGQIDPGPMEDRLIQKLRKDHDEYRDTREPAPDHYYSSWREELDLADEVVVNSKWSLRALKEEGVEDGRLNIVSIPYETDDVPEPRAIPSEFSDQRPLRLLFLGQVNLRKGIVELLEAMDSLDGLPIELDFVGGLQVEIPERFRNLSSVKFVGGVPRSMIDSHLKRADLFVFPTHSDGFGLTQVESLATGLPVLVSQNCAQVIDDGVNGKVLAEVSASEIANSLRGVLSKPALLRNWSENCCVPEDCRMESVSQKLCKLLERL